MIESTGAAGSRGQATLIGPGEFEFSERSVGEVPAGYVRLHVAYTGICGSDFPIVDGTHPRAEFPLVLGHEITGTLSEALGELPAGTRVAVNPLIPCGACGACTAGLTHVCRALKLLGIDTNGSMANTMDAPIASIHAFRETVEPLSAAWAEPLAVAVHAVRRSMLESGEQALIFGAGPIGILVALVARQRGATGITLVEPSPERRATARTLGFEALAPQEVRSARERNDHGPDVVFDCAGHHSVVPQLTQVAPVRGRIVIVAVHHGAAPIDLRELAFAEQTITGVRVYESADFATAVDLINDEQLPLHEIPISRYPLNEVSAAFSEARSGSGAVKVFIESRNS